MVVLFLAEEEPLFHLLQNYLQGFKLRRQNNVKGGGRWTNRQVKSRLGNPQLCHDLGNNHTLVKLSSTKIALISNQEQEVVATGHVKSFEHGKAIKDDNDKVFFLYQAASSAAGDGWASKEFRVLLCEYGKMKDIPLQKVLYRDIPPKIHSEEEGLKIVQYGTWPYKTDFTQKNSLLDTEKMCLTK